MNTISVIGNLTKKPEIKYIGNNSPVTSINIAWNEKYKDTNKVHYFEVEVWGTLAENCVKYLDKGSKISVSGKLNQQSWKNKEGNNCYKTFIKAIEIDFLSTNNSQEHNNTVNSPEPKVSQPQQEEKIDDSILFDDDDNYDFLD